MRILVALGGNALAHEGQRGTWKQQRASARVVARGLAGLHAAGHAVVVAHGNGPQVGALAIQQARAVREVPGLPVDVLVAMTQPCLFGADAERDRPAHTDTATRSTTAQVPSVVTPAPCPPASASAWGRRREHAVLSPAASGRCLPSVRRARVMLERRVRVKRPRWLLSGSSLRQRSPSVRRLLRRGPQPWTRNALRNTRGLAGPRRRGLG